MVKRLRADGVSQFTFSRAGDEWRVFPLHGHLVNIDYPETLNDWAKTDLSALIDADSIDVPTDSATVEALRQASKDVEEIIVATDYDREGELIGREAVRIVHEIAPSATVRRAKFSALTRRELLTAFEHLADLDDHLASSAAAREVVDLAWGAVLTRFLSLTCERRGSEILSVGRVQTPTLALVTGREREIEEFVPTPWWRVVATLAAGDVEFPATHANGEFWHLDEAEAAQGLAELATEGRVMSVGTQTEDERPPVPLNTTLFIGLANRAGFTAAKAMSIAESLYRDGLLSYPRTDNTVYPRTLSLRATVEELLESDFKAEAKQVLALPEIHPMRGRTESTDHPPIYPTGAATRAKMKPDRWRVYEIVVRRFLATLSPPAVYEVTKARIDVNDIPFVAEGARTLALGWRTLVSDEPEGPMLPSIAPDGTVGLQSISVEKGMTRPPPRFTQGMLIQEMETKGLGTKSTRHEIVQKLYDRGYVSGRFVRPTDGGRAVAESLLVYAPVVTRPETTAELETRLEAIAEGQDTPESVIQESRARLHTVLRELEAHREGVARWIRESLEWERDHGPCEKCGSGHMVVRKSRYGARFLGCTNYPKCRNTRAVTREEFVVRAPPSEASFAE